MCVDNARSSKEKRTTGKVRFNGCLLFMQSTITNKSRECPSSLRRSHFRLFVIDFPSVLTDNMEKIFVSIRVRPLSKAEAAKGSPWKLGSNSITLCNSKGAPVPGQSYVFGTRFPLFFRRQL